MVGKRGSLVVAVWFLGACGGQAKEGDHADSRPGAVEERRATPSPSFRHDTPNTARSPQGVQQAAAAAGSAAPADWESTGGADSVPLGEEEALAFSLAAIAESQGWTMEQAERYHAGTEAVGAVAERVSAERPDSFVGSAVGPAPEDPPRLYIKGTADAFIDELVASSPVMLRVIDQQPFSRSELDARQATLVGVLQEVGYREFAVGADIERNGLLEGDVRVIPGLPTTEQELLPRIPVSLRDAVRITFY